MADSKYNKFKDFIELHTLGNLIDPDTGVAYRMSKSYFDNRKHHINREFFKKLGKLTDEIIERLLKYLVDIDEAEGAPKYPRLSFHKTRHYRRSTCAVGDWIIRHKSKEIAWTEMKAIMPHLPFFSPKNDTINMEKWKAWKEKKGFSTASWNMLLSHVESKYYSTRLQNLGKCKTAKELKAIFPGVEDFFRNFLKLKTNQRAINASFSLRTFDSMSMTLGPRWDKEAPTGSVSLGLFDLRDTAYALCKSDDASKEYFKSLISKVALLSKPSYKDPTVWVWIVSGTVLKKLEKLRALIQAAFPNYTMSASTYKPAKAERLYNVPHPEKSANDVQLVFLFKKNACGNEYIHSNKLEFKAPQVPYYLDTGHYNETKWMAKESELRMEFYLELLKTYCKKGDSVLGIFSGSKFMVASLVHPHSCIECFFLAAELSPGRG